jgi:hypothetical protein
MVKGQSSILEQEEDRISEVEDKTEIKEKTEEIFLNNTRAVKGR